VEMWCREVSCTNGGIDLNVGAGSELFDCNSGLLDEGIEDRQNESTRYKDRCDVS